MRACPKPLRADRFGGPAALERVPGAGPEQLPPRLQKPTEDAISVPKPIRKPIRPSAASAASASGSLQTALSKVTRRPAIPCSIGIIAPRHFRQRSNVYRPQCRVRGWLLVENSTVEILDAASLEVHSAFHPGPKPLETGAAGPVLYWLPGASALNRSTS